ncbi:MAG: ABC transporter permease, partial [Halobacteriales archaeon]|nr:ABC transporter permease [Halobacteriales archaeon]
MSQDGFECDGGVLTTSAQVASMSTVNETSSLPERIRQVAVIADQEYRLSLRTRWALALTAVMALFATLVVGFGGTELGPARVDAVVVSLASLATFLVPLVALAFGFDAIVGAEESGWLGVLFSLPMPRWCIVLGVYLGRAMTLAGATAVGFGIAGTIVLYFAGVGSLGLYE